MKRLNRDLRYKTEIDTRDKQRQTRQRNAQRQQTETRDTTRDRTAPAPAPPVGLEFEHLTDHNKINQRRNETAKNK